MPKKTDDELRALYKMFESDTPFEEYPDGATWADLEDAKKLHDKEQNAD